MRNQEAKVGNGSAVSGKAKIATTEAGQWKIGQHDYQVAIVDRGEKFLAWRWDVTVTECEVLIASGRGYVVPLCLPHSFIGIAGRGHAGRRTAAYVLPDSARPTRHEARRHAVE